VNENRQRDRATDAGELNRALSSVVSGQLRTCDHPVPTSQAPYRRGATPEIVPQGPIRAVSPRSQTPFAGPFKSGRQDLNLRPPGPQPERLGAAQIDATRVRRVLAPECVPVALNLFPKLFPSVRRPIGLHVPGRRGGRGSMGSVIHYRFSSGTASAMWVRHDASFSSGPGA
jgi:hypothetical protein